MPATFNERPHQNEKAEALTYVRYLMEQARKESNHEELPKLEKLIGLIDSKRYGLVWEEHAELVEEEMKIKIPVFIEDEIRKIHGNPDSTDYNFLLEGDNLHSLHLLKKTHAGKIDVIYIDPPYNTGNKDFVYNDKIVDKTDGYSHSKWLSFMSKRLELARELLSETGIIFISIDDNEQAQLKLLCDEIFGNKNYLNTIVVKAKTSSGASGGGQDKKLKKNFEYILIYLKNETVMLEKPIKKIKISDYISKHKENKVGFYYTRILEECGERKLIKEDEGIKIYQHQNFRFSTVVEKMKLENLSIDEVYNKYFSKIFMVTNAQTSILNRINRIMTEKGKLISYDYIPKSGKFRGQKITKYVWNQTLVVWFAESAIKEGHSVYKTLQIGNLWDDISWGRLDLQGGVSLKNGKKPLSLLNRLLKISVGKNSTILDFFAGSGTTGHAVAQLNKEDGGNRKYILCTNNENNICEEVTYKRLSNIQEELPHNLKYFKTQFIDKDDEDLEYALLNNVKTLIELEHAIDLKESDKTVAFTLSEIRNLDLTGIKTVYVRQHSHALMEKEDRLRYEGVELVDVPEYYFAKEMSEAGL